MTNDGTQDPAKATPLNELNNEIQEILWSYGYPFDEKIKQDNYNQKIYRKRKDKATQAIQDLLAEQVRLERKAELTYLLEDFGVEDNVEPIKKRIAQLKDITKEDE